MNAYKTQYWLWASLNKRFGKGLRLERSGLHRTYEVNRHCFDVSSSDIPLEQVHAWFQEFLIAACFEKDPKTPSSYKKSLGRKTIFLTMEKIKGMDGKDYIPVFLHLYKSSKTI